MSKQVKYAKDTGKSIPRAHLTAAQVIKLNEGRKRWMSHRIITHNGFTYDGKKSVNDAFYRRIMHYVGYPTDQINYTCTLFKYMKDNVSINYSIMFSVVDDTPLLRLREIPTKDKYPFIEYYCNNPSLLSQDGEYRGPTFRSEELRDELVHYQRFYDYINDILIEYLNDKKIMLEFENFAPQTKVDEHIQVLSNYIVDKNLLYNFYTNFWLLQMDNMEKGLQENHINPKYMSIVFDDMKTQRVMFEKIKKYFGQEFIGFMDFLRYGGRVKVENNSYVPDVKKAWPTGQKLRPLKVSEVANPFQLASPAWREVFLSCRVNMLMMNYCCSTFPTFAGWFYVKNSKKTIFDNDAQYIKRERSERAIIIASKLREASRLTHTQQIVHKNVIKTYAYELFDVADQKINNPLTFIVDNILMSNVTMGMFMEHTGRTIFDLPILEKSETWIKQNGAILTDDKVMKKLIFDICYSIHTLNVNGMTHSDLHLNNITVLSKPENQGIDRYIVGPIHIEMPEYPKAFLIDFSRGTINPNAIEDDIIFPRAMGTTGTELFITDQNDRIMKKLSELAPSITKLHGEQLKKLIMSNFEPLYKIYTATDFYDFSSKMLLYLDKIISADIKKLLKKIKTISEYYLTNYLINYISNNDMNVDAPSITILKECFQEFFVKPSTTLPDYINNVWNPAGFGWKFSTNSKLPPEFQEVKTRSVSGIVKKPNTQFSVALLQYFDLRKTDYLKMIEYIADKHRIIGKYA